MIYGKMQSLSMKAGTLEENAKLNPCVLQWLKDSDRPILLTNTDIYRYRYIGIGISVSVSVFVSVRKIIKYYIGIGKYQNSNIGIGIGMCKRYQSIC